MCSIRDGARAEGPDPCRATPWIWDFIMFNLKATGGLPTAAFRSMTAAARGELAGEQEDHLEDTAGAREWWAGEDSLRMHVGVRWAGVGLLRGGLGGDAAAFSLLTGQRTARRS